MNNLIIKRHYYIWFLFIAFILLPGQSKSQTQFESTNISEVENKVKKIMILHLGEIYDNRKTVESEITYWLNKYKFDASPSHRYFDQNQIPKKEKIKEVLTKNDFDGILTTLVITLEAKESFKNPQSAYNLNLNSPTFYNYLDSYQNKYSTGYTIQENSIVVKTSLFITENEQIIYEATSKTEQAETFDVAVESFSKAIAKSLKSSKLLEKKK